MDHGCHELLFKECLPTPRAQEEPHSDTQDLCHVWWGDPSGLSTRIGTPCVDNTSYPYWLRAMELRWWAKDSPPRHGFRMLRLTSVGGGSWELWEIKEGATLKQCRTQVISERPNPWKRHISLDRCPIGETKDLISIYSKIKWG